MTLPPLPNWQETRISLHRAAQVVGAVKRTVHEPLPNWAHLGLYPTSSGLTTGPLSLGELTLDFGARTIYYRQASGNMAAIPLDGQTQVSLTDALLKTLGGAGHNLTPNRDKLTATAPLTIDAAIAKDYAQALYRIYTAIARFRAKLIGPMSPAIVWSHGFDLSFLWFEGLKMEEQTDAHLNFGFSPGSPGLDRPYFYVYMSPWAEGVVGTSLPAPAQWHTQGWTGVVINYDEVAREQDPENVIESLLYEIYRLLSSRMG